MSNEISHNEEDENATSILDNSHTILTQSLFESMLENNGFNARPEQLSDPRFLEKKKKEVEEMVTKYQKNLSDGVSLYLEKDTSETISKMMDKLYDQAAILAIKEKAGELDSYTFPEDLFTAEECGKMYEIAYNEYQEGHADNAVKLFNVMSIYFPGNPFGWMGLIQTAYTVNNPDFNALELCEKSQKNFESEPNMQVFCAEFYRQLSDMEKARDLAKHALDLLEHEPDQELEERARSILE
jgi:predicted Zn-dependent protease